MNTFKILVTSIAVFSLLTFIVLFGHVPSLRRTPVGWTHYLLMIIIPRVLARLDQEVSGGRISVYLSKKQNQAMNERHPTVLIFYLVLFIGGTSIYVLRVLPMLSAWHWMLVPGLIFMPLYTLYLAANTDPGYITAKSHAEYIDKYEYDGVLFRRGHKCASCRREKPARSKHCGICKNCIAKHDHHCIWINSCVGEKNMKWFLAFLLANVVTFTYATITFYLLFAESKRQYQSQFYDFPIPEDKPIVRLTGVQLWMYLLRRDVSVGSLFLFVTICDLLVTAFLLYHSYLVFSGVTTNETLKFEDIRLAIQDGQVDLYSSGDGRFYLDVAGKNNPVGWNQLENVYDQGWRKNLSNVFKER